MRRRASRGVLRIVILVEAAFATASCGGNAEDDRSPSEQCEDMGNAYCAKIAECAPATDRTEQGEDCEFSFRIQLSCDDVTVTGNVADCLRALDAVDCGSFDVQKEALPFPDSCKGILTIRGTP